MMMLMMIVRLEIIIINQSMRAASPNPSYGAKGSFHASPSFLFKDPAFKESRGSSSNP